MDTDHIILTPQPPQTIGRLRHAEITRGALRPAWGFRYNDLGASVLERRENVVFLGPLGVGKTHLAISLAVATAESGRRVYYATLADLTTLLEEAQLSGQVTRRLRTLSFPALMIIDKISYLPISRTGAMLFFSVDESPLRACEHGAHEQQALR